MSERASFQPGNVIVTGAAGFIGSSFVRQFLTENPEVSVTVLDSLTYAGNLENLAPVAADPRYQFFHGDINRVSEIQSAFAQSEARFGKPVDTVIHFAAESHVDRSIEDPSLFLQTNVVGTGNLLKVSRDQSVGRFVHVSTDEVYGSLDWHDPAFSEETPLAPNSPYAASKAGSDLVARSYFETYGFPVLITRCSNNYGPYQFPEKLIPLMIANALEDKPLPVYGTGENIRDWIYVDDHSSGVESVLKSGQPGGVYNLGGESERTNIDVVRTLLRILGKEESLIRYVTDRPGHDRRYAMNIEKANRELGWSPTVEFEVGLQKTVDWYLANADWVSRVRSLEYQSYYARMYSDRLH